MDHLLRCPSGLRELGGDAMPADTQPPRQGEAVVVVGIVEGAKASWDSLIDTRSPVVGRTEIERGCEPGELGFGAQPAVASLRGRFCRSDERFIRVIEGAELGQGLAEVHQERRPLRAILEERRGPAQEARGRRHVAACECSPSRRPEPHRRSAAKFSAVVVKRAEVHEIAVCLLEVVAQDLLELGTPLVRSVDAVNPVDEPLVKLRALPLEEALICGVADEDVVEPEAILVERSRPPAFDQALALDFMEVLRDVTDQ